MMREERDLRRDIARHGLVVMRYARGRHHKFLVRTIEGKRALIVFPITSGDRRAVHNGRAALRRLANSET